MNSSRDQRGALKTMSYDFRGASVVISGGGQGIGLELVRFFASAGAAVYALDRDADAVAAVSEFEGCVGINCDVTDTDSVAAAVSRVVEATGRVDVLVNNAGILRDAVLWKLTDDDWNVVLAVHLGGAFRLTRAAVPQMRQQAYGRIINVTSYSGLHGNVGQANYSAAKAGIVGFTKTAAKELAGFGITVNAISPSAETRMIASIPAERRRELEALIPLGRFGQPQEMCDSVGFLASREAGYVTGVILPVDGGISI